MNHAKRETTGVKLEVNQRWSESFTILIFSKSLSFIFLPATFFILFQHSILGSCSDLMKVRHLSTIKSFSVNLWFIFTLFLVIVLCSPLRRQFTCWWQLLPTYRKTLWKEAEWVADLLLGLYLLNFYTLHLKIKFRSEKVNWTITHYIYQETHFKVFTAKTKL